MAGAHRMVARRATDAARRAAQSEQSKAAHRAAQAALPQEEKTRKPKAEHGKQIWIFNHLQTNQVVYSLNAAMKNNASLRQLPYNGKKTVPSALRKDLWNPLCQITFPHSPPAPISPKGRKPSALALAPKNINTLGLAAFQKLREYRRRHELEWDVTDFRNEKGVLLGKKARGRKLCDQRANAIADLAAVLSEVTGADGEAVAVQGGESKEEVLESVDVDSSKQVIVRWSDLLDAEYAEKWSPNVVHDVMVYTKNNRDPALYARYIEQGTVEKAVP